MADPRYPHLPPPPNPAGLKTFVDWCVEETVNQMNKENTLEKGRDPRNPEEGRA